MTGPAPDVVVAASRLRAALEETAAALAGADLERLLASDALLRKILSEMPPSGPGGRPSPALQRDIEDAQAALGRCRRLGESLGSFVRLSLDAHGGLGYEPGRARVASMTGRTFSERA